MPNPVTYAEETLGVHKVYDEAQKCLADLDSSTSELDAAMDRKRELVAQINAREADVWHEERSRHSDYSQTALDKHVKQQKAQDEALKKLSTDLRSAESEISGIEYDIDVTKYTLRTLNARMEQLGGYFNFLAAAKNAEVVSMNQTATTGDTE